MSAHEEAQRVIIGSLHCWPEYYHDLKITVADFTLPDCRRMFEAITALWSEGVQPDMLSVEDWTTREQGRSINAMEMAELRKYAVNGLVLLEAARLLAQHSIEAKVRTTALFLSRSEARGDALLAEAMTAFNHIEQPAAGESVALGRAVDAMLREAERRQAGDAGSQILTGVEKIDEHQFLERGGVLTVAGRPSMGKSAFVQYLSQRWAEEGEAVLVFSTETPSTKLARRFVASDARLNSREIARGKDSVETWRQMAASASRLADLPIWIDDSSADAALVARSIRRHRQRHGITVAVVDHIQECIPGKEPRNELNQFIAQVRAACREQPRVALVMVSQLSRRVEGRETKKPRMSDLKESGKIEEVSDAILLMFRPHYYRDQGKEFKDADPGELQVNVAKNRDGPTGWIRMSWDNERGQVRGVLADRRRI
jgi:replicative DNA helicase